MSVDLTSIMQKATNAAEQATNDDRAGNREAAVQGYLSAAEWLMHATKYGTLNDTMKKNIRAKISSYLQRAEALKAPADTPAAPTPALANPTAAREDPDALQIMQKFQGAIITNPDVTFDDVVGLEQAKAALEEAVILPVKYPRLFRGKRKPWAGILLYGPPGTGKSYLAMAIATECKNTFISVSAADLLSKWLGDSEKGVKTLFELARKRRPCIVFIDEIESICGQRGDSGSDATQRVLTQFLVEMQGVGNDNAGVLVLAATNLPWTLDTAIRRRFEKRIYIPLPELNERASMFKKHLGTDIPNTIKENEWMQLAEKSKRYSGADIGVVCREALLRPIRRLLSGTHFKKIPNPNQGEGEPSHVWLVCSPGDPNAQEMTLNKIHPDEVCEPPVTMSDMLSALETQRATVSEADLGKYEDFTKQFGQNGV